MNIILNILNWFSQNILEITELLVLRFRRNLMSVDFQESFSRLEQAVHPCPGAISSRRTP